VTGTIWITLICHPRHISISSGCVLEVLENEVQKVDFIMPLDIGAKGLFYDDAGYCSISIVSV
jgi:hypothetical protein